MQDFITIWQYIQDCLFFNNVYGQNCEKTEKSLPFKAGASHLWTNVETVHRTVSLSLLASQASAFAPISGPNPHYLYKNKNQSQK